MILDRKISPLIPQQFPAFYHEQGPNFIAFVQAYYEWMETSGQPIYESRSLLDNLNIDATANSFINHFKTQYISLLPDSIVVDKRLLIKHVLDLYRSKGSPRAYRLLFRILFNEDIEIYVPNEHIFKSSDGVWDVPEYIEVTGSPYLDDIVGKPIYSSGSRATAVVETYNKIIRDNCEINVLFLGGVRGTFNYGDKILCDYVYVNSDDVIIDGYSYQQLKAEEQEDYSIALTDVTGPIIIGSMNSMAIENGGYDYKIGDILEISGSGSEGKLRVAATQDYNGKVVFKLIAGGSGFSLGAVVSVVGGGGSGATFKVGGITNKEIYNYNTNIIDDYYDATLDDAALGMNVYFTAATGAFSGTGNLVTSTANVIVLDCSPTTVQKIVNGSVISNTALGISLLAYRSEGSLIWCTSSADSALTNANIVAGAVLGNTTQNAFISIKTAWPKATLVGNAVIVTSNSTMLAVNQVNGIFISTKTIRDVTTAVTATISTVARKTNWGFPSGVDDNLDQIFINSLVYKILEVGTITYINGINPGQGYNADPTVTILEPEIYALSMDDGVGGKKGFNAIVTGKATNARGVVTAVNVFGSGFGYLPGETIQAASIDITKPSVVTGTAIVTSQGKSPGRYIGNKGFISDTNYLQDSQFYQLYSYQLIAPRMLDTYSKFVKDLVHPAGIALYGKYQLKSEFNSPGSLTQSSIATL